MDYKELLRKYINHVGYEEGTDFLNINCGEFTEEEFKELQDISGRPFPESKETLVRTVDYLRDVKKTMLEDLKT